MLSLLLSFLVLQSTPALGIERYEIDARHSIVGFDGTSTLHDFTGKTHAITGDLRADRADPARITGGAVWIEARTLDTDNGSRDEKMREHLDVKKHPQIVFHLDSVAGKLVGGRGEFTAEGRFTIKGVEKPRQVKFHVDPVPPAKDNSGRDLRVQGELRFKMTDHGIERPGVMFVTVDDEVRVWLDLRLRPVPDIGVDARARTLRVEEEFAPSAAGAQPWKRAGTEIAWTSGASGTSRLWERRLEPAWFLGNDGGIAAIDLSTGVAQPAAEIVQQAMAQLAKPGIAGTTWTATVDETAGRRTLRITFADEIPVRMPSWALDPKSWANGPSPAPAR